MKENVKVDSVIVNKVRKHVQKTKQTIGGFVESAIEFQFNPKYDVIENSLAFERFLSNKGVKFKRNGSHTTIIGNNDLFYLGIEFGVYKYEDMVRKERV